MKKESQAYKNTDKELWRQPTTTSDGGNDSGMEPTVFVTAQGGVGFNHYGTCFVKPIEAWVELAKQEFDKDPKNCTCGTNSAYPCQVRHRNGKEIMTIPEIIQDLEDILVTSLPDSRKLTTLALYLEALKREESK